MNLFYIIKQYSDSSIKYWRLLLKNLKKEDVKIAYQDAVHSEIVRLHSSNAGAQLGYPRFHFVSNAWTLLRKYLSRVLRILLNVSSGGS